jgi:hypothetical protein
MSTTAPMLVVYWLKDGGSGKFPVPPLISVIDNPPFPSVVNLFAAPLAIQSDNTVGITIPDSINTVFSSNQAATLQRAGISIVLSVVNGAGGLGWSTLTGTQNEQLATAISSIVQTTGINGIDIDDEGVGGQPQNFYDTVCAIREANPDIIISNAIYDPFDYSKYSGYPKLIDQISYCCTMVYGDDYDSIISNVQWFHQAGIPMNQLCAGVQAGPARTKCDNGSFTSIPTTQQVAQWAKANALGVMLFTYSQDIVAFTGCPQHGPWPDPNDHAWQAAISAILFAKT